MRARLEQLRDYFRIVFMDYARGAGKALRT